MVQKIRTSIIVILSIINIFCIFAIFLLNTNLFDVYQYKKDINYNPENINKFNSTNSYNQFYNKRKLYHKYYSYDFSSYFIIILTLNCLAVFFWIFLISSFCYGEKECGCERGCRNCGSNNCNCACNNNGDAGKAALASLIFLGFILIIYYSLKKCGKHIVRYIVLASMGIINFCILIFSLSVINNYNFYHIFPIMVVSGISIISNFLAILLPNIKSCEILRYQDRIPSFEIMNYNLDSNQNSQFNNNIIVNNNMNMQNNGQNPINYPSYQNNPVPIVDNEYNADERNEGINNNNSNNQLFENINKDNIKAPLPAFEMEIKSQ